MSNSTRANTTPRELWVVKRRFAPATARSSTGSARVLPLGPVQAQPRTAAELIHRSCYERTRSPARTQRLTSNGEREKQMRWSQSIRLPGGARVNLSMNSEDKQGRWDDFVRVRL